MTTQLLFDDDDRPCADDRRQKAYDQALDRYLEPVLAYAEYLRRKLGPDILEEAEAISAAGDAILDFVEAQLAGRVHGLERPFLFRVTHNKVVKRFDAELWRVKPQARAERRHRQAMLDLEEAIRAAEAAGSPLSPEEIAAMQAEIDRALADAPHRDYFGDDGISEAGIPDRDDAYERAVNRLSAQSCVARILAHRELGRRRETAFREMLAHGGQRIPGGAWSKFGWTPGNGAQAVLETKAWIKSTFPEIGREFL